MRRAPFLLVSMLFSIGMAGCPSIPTAQADLPRRASANVKEAQSHRDLSTDAALARQTYEAFRNNIDTNEQLGAIWALEMIEDGNPGGAPKLASMMWGQLQQKHNPNANLRWAPVVLEIYEASCRNGNGDGCGRAAELRLPRSRNSVPAPDLAAALALYERGCTARYVSSAACVAAALAYVGQASDYSSLDAEFPVARDPNRFLQLMHRGCVVGVDTVPNAACASLTWVFSADPGGGDRYGFEPNEAIANQYRQLQPSADTRTQQLWAIQEAEWNRWYTAYKNGERAEEERDRARLNTVLDALASGIRQAAPAPVASFQGGAWSAGYSDGPANVSAPVVQPASQAGGTGCSGCPQACAGLTAACQGGSQAGCYRAAACLCQCNLDQGGCGSSAQGLSRCVAQNEESAQQLAGNGGAVGPATPLPQNQQPQPDPNTNSQCRTASCGAVEAF